MAARFQVRTLALMLLPALVLGCKSGAQVAPPSIPAASPAAPQALPPQASPQATNPPPAAGSIALVSATGPLPPQTALRPLTAALQQPELVPAGIQAVQQPLRLSLFDAVEMALAQNPDLIAQRYAEGASEGALGVAETYPFNPYVQIQVTPSQSSEVSNTGPKNHYVLLMQQLQLAHQRQHRTAAAAAALESVRWNYVQAKLVNMATTQRLFFAALYQREIAELAGAQADLNTQLRIISERQLAAGQITGVDVAIVRLDNVAARRQAALASANYQTALLDLRRHIGLPLAAPLELAGRLTDWRWHEVSGESAASAFVPLEIPVTTDRAWLARTLASGRPDVFAAGADVESARANLDLARANRIPDLQIGPYYQQNNDPTIYWGLRAHMDIPVLNTGAPLVRQRLAELTQRHAIWEQLLNRATLEAEFALDRYDRALRLALDSEASVGEELPAELVRLEEQFKAGEVDLVRVVTGRTSFFQARRASLDTLNELALASSTLIAATALPPESLLTSPDSAANRPPR
jgi:outer membrane protein, heavy metal efflux system